MLRALLLSFALGCMAPALAQETAAWQFGTANQRDSRQHMATLSARNLLAGGGTINDYAPLFSVSCVEGDRQHWQQQLILEEPLTSRGIITIWVRIDGDDVQEQQWVVTGNKRVATKVGVADLARLSRARRLELEWNWGWSWLWLSDKAVFELADMHTVLFELGKRCSVPTPE